MFKVSIGNRFKAYAHKAKKAVFKIISLLKGSFNLPVYPLPLFRLWLIFENKHRPALNHIRHSGVSGQCIYSGHVK
jgi:hypothetical protein